MTTSYQVKHKLTKKLVLDNELKPIVFKTMGAAELFLEVKLKIMGANFYDIVECENEDPTPYCNACKSMSFKNCKCGPIAENE